MKLTALIMLTAVLQVGAWTNAQTITLSVKNAPLTAVFSSIQKQTGLNILVDARILENAQPVSLDVKERPVDEVMHLCLRNQPFQFSMDANSIIVKPKQTAGLNTREFTSPASPPFTGRVVGEEGNPLEGVSVTVKGTNRGTSTAADGSFSIECNTGETLEFTIVGYQRKSVRIDEQTVVVNVTLELEVSDLSDVVVVGYGSQKKATVTGAISMVSGEKLEQAPNINFTNSLVGRLPGLTAVTGSSEPGRDDSRLRIRGGNTLGDNSPLIVVDGVIGRNISRLNPSDVLSVTVLKDASAAIYGAQAANGVILVTTKRGKIGKPTVQINLNQGWTSPTVIPEMADAASYAQMINEVSLYRGSPLQFTDEDIQKYRDGSDPWSYPNTDWFAETFKKSAVQQAADISVTGGSEFLKYFVSFGTNFQDGIYKNSGTNYGQANFRGNFDVKLSKDINLSLNLNGQKENRHYPTVPTSTIWATTINGLPIITAYWPNGLPGPDTQLGKSPLQATDATG